MEFISGSFARAFALIASLDPDVISASLTSLKVSGLATAFACLFGIPIGLALATSHFFGRRLIIAVLNTFMALPTVAVGLAIYALISRAGPMGGLGLLFTIPAMVVGEFILILPIVAALTLAAVKGVDARVRPTALALGASRLQTSLATLAEARYGILAAVMAGFGRAIAEVGAAMILGGNIRGFTRTLTTAIALETGKGEFALALALGLILLTLAFSANIIFYLLQAGDGRGRPL